MSPAGGRNGAVKLRGFPATGRIPGTLAAMAVTAVFSCLFRIVVLPGQAYDLHESLPFGTLIGDRVIAACRLAGATGKRSAAATDPAPSRRAGWQRAFDASKNSAD